MDEYGLSYQQELIGMILKNAELLKGDTFNSDVLPKRFKETYDYLKMSYDKYQRLDVQMLTDNPFIDVFEVVEWKAKVTRCSPIDYKHLKMILVDEHRKEEIKDHYMRLNSGMMDIERFISTVNLMRSEDNTLIKKVSETDLNAFMRKRDTRIRFHDFCKLEENGNINEGDFVILAGGTGTGKTALALNLALDLAYNYPIVYINIELSQDTLLKRMIASFTQTSMSVIDNRMNVPQSEIDKMMELGKFLDTKEFYIATGSQTVEDIQTIVSNFEQDKHFIVIIDHIGRITSDKESYERMTQTSIAIRNLALDYNCTVLGLCQLNRAHRNEQSPHNGLLRDSGEVEQSARKVMFIWDYESEDEPDENGLYMWFTKNDSGATVKIPIMFNKETQRIREVNNNANPRSW